MDKEVLKDMYLIDELNTVSSLIKLGFGELQNLNATNDFYHLPLQLLSSGFERLMKGYICLAYYEKHNKYPNTLYLKKCGGKSGHGLIELKTKILSNIFNTFDIPALIDDKKYIEKDYQLGKLMFILSEFGKYARYHNLNIITDAVKPSVDAKGLWEEFESELVNKNKGLSDKFNEPESIDDANRELNQLVIIILEKFARGICRQFTIGQLSKKAKQYSPIFDDFIRLSNDQLGTIDYRKVTTNFKQITKIVRKISIYDNIARLISLNRNYKKVVKNSFNGIWPFTCDEVVIECRHNQFCLVEIEKHYYGLNGSAMSKYNLMDVHDAGMAILGKSINPFIDIALNLSKENR